MQEVKGAIYLLTYLSIYLLIPLSIYLLIPLSRTVILFRASLRLQN